MALTQGSAPASGGDLSSAATLRSCSHFRHFGILMDLQSAYMVPFADFANFLRLALLISKGKFEKVTFFLQQGENTPIMVPIKRLSKKNIIILEKPPISSPQGGEQTFWERHYNVGEGGGDIIKSLSLWIVSSLDLHDNPDVILNRQEPRKLSKDRTVQFSLMSGGCKTFQRGCEVLQLLISYLMMTSKSSPSCRQYILTMSKWLSRASSPANRINEESQVKEGRMHAFHVSFQESFRFITRNIFTMQL